MAAVPGEVQGNGGGTSTGSSFVRQPRARHLRARSVAPLKTHSESVITIRFLSWKCCCRLSCATAAMYHCRRVVDQLPCTRECIHLRHSRRGIIAGCSAIQQPPVAIHKISLEKTPYTPPPPRLRGKNKYFALL